MYDNEFETKKKQFKPRIKLNHNTYTAGWLTGHRAKQLRGCEILWTCSTIASG